MIICIENLREFTLIDIRNKTGNLAKLLDTRVIYKIRLVSID